MHIAILGAGNGGSAVAADLSLRGHEVTLIKTSRAMHDKHFEHLIESGGRIALVEPDGERRVARIAHVTRDLTALRSAQLVIVYIRTDFHEPLVKRMAPLLAGGQIALFNPGYLSTAYLLKHGAPEDVISVEAQSSFIDCRIARPGVIQVGFRNVRNPLGIYPPARADKARQALDAVGLPFVYLGSVAEAALHNPNLIVHTVGAIMSIPRIEATGGDYCMYHEVFTPSVWRLMEALDGEKMDVLEKLGFSRVPYAEMCRLRNSRDLSRDAKRVFHEYASMPTRAKGPTSVDSRYITEDVPQGLALLEALGQSLAVPTPVCSALIEVASAALGRDMRQGARTLEGLGRQNVRKILEQGA